MGAAARAARLRPNDSAVTVFYVWGNVWAEHLRTYWEEKLKAMLVGLEPSRG